MTNVDNNLENVLRQSPNWPAHEADGYTGSFPFDEGFPDVGPTENPRPQFALIFEDGTGETGVVDFSRQYRAEGLSWLTGASYTRRLGCHVVKAWCEIPSKTTDQTQ